MQNNSANHSVFSRVFNSGWLSLRGLLMGTRGHGVAMPWFVTFTQWGSQLWRRALGLPVLTAVQGENQSSSSSEGSILPPDSASLESQSMSHQDGTSADEAVSYTSGFDSDQLAQAASVLASLVSNQQAKSDNFLWLKPKENAFGTQAGAAPEWSLMDDLQLHSEKSDCTSVASVSAITMTFTSPPPAPEPEPELSGSDCLPKLTEVQSPSQTRLKVADLCGHIHRLSIFRDATVAQLKSKIHGEMEIPPAQQRLIFSGVQLEDECNLQQYGIHDESTVHLILKLKGD